MSRIALITPEIATREQHALLHSVGELQGYIPNLLRIVANSPAALRAFLDLHSLTRDGSLDLPTRERIAIALAQKNGSTYCLSAHAQLGSQAGLNGAEMESNRLGDSHDAKAAVAVRFACRLIEQRGDLDDDQLRSMRNAGYSDAEIVEVIAHTGMNFLSNLMSKVSQVEIDFPLVSLN
ncbi:alkyl hydroperoxide reductase AhpD [Chitinimonas prasina]|uniref:Alkyl hydroperoxide reductase AhpD n=1 Tax=Chitinimonas prasina TaxID=1434937 RepID=A0ABQ5YET2_9NEIS|nr:carboxymuconolactone decarboxylase family protein [Chitinimonas prasina]GLR13470.1 alkyl hydroperoxide reductase AhpD [Chitinimonas prasina]